MKAKNLITSVIALNLALVNLPLKAETISDSQMEEFHSEISSLRSSIKISAPQVDSEEQDTKSATAPATQSKGQGSPLKDAAIRYGIKTIGGFIGTALFTDWFTNKGLEMVEGVIVAATGNTWLAKGTKVAAYNTVYALARESSFVVGFRALDILESAAQIVKSPKAVLSTLEEVALTGLKMATTSISCYLFTQPINDLAADGVYYTTLFTTSSPMLANGTYWLAKGAMHYTGAGNMIAKIIGLNGPEIIGSTVSTVSSVAKTVGSAISSLKGWWSGTAAPVAATAA